MPDPSFPEWLRRLREERLLTIADLARAAKISERALHGLESGRTVRPHPSTIRQLAEALGLSEEVRSAFVAAARPGQAEIAPQPEVAPESAGRAEVPRTLPRDIRSFTGREAELNSLMEVASAASGPVGVYVIEGMAGIGKTSLALRAGHELAGQFPDGQLFLDLHGYVPGLEATGPAEALRTLLHELGVSDEFIPERVEDGAALLRSRLAGTKTLIILDSAESPEQVRPLLPGTGGSLVIITSRRSLAGLDDAEVIALETLSLEESIALFRAVANRNDILEADHRLGELVELCGFLPLAIRIVAAWMSRRKAASVGDVLTELRGEFGPLARLADMDPKLIAVFEMSVRHLSERDQDVFHRLALIPGPDFDPMAVASLVGRPVSAARRSLESLLDHNLLIQQVSGRFLFHDLIRMYARSTAAPADAETSVRRLLDYYLSRAQAADRLFELRIPAVSTDSDQVAAGAAALENAKDAQTWLAAELANLDAAGSYASTGGYPEHVTALAAALGQYLRGHGPWPMGIVMQERALAIATATGDLAAEATALGFLGIMHRQAAELAMAGDYFGRALSRYEQTGQRYGQAAMLVELGVIHRLTGKHASAVGYLDRALGLYRELASRHGEAGVLTELGGLRRQTGSFGASEQALRRALVLYRELGNRSGEAAALGYLGSTLLSTGEYAEAEETLKHAFAIHLELDDPFNQANNLLMLGGVYRDTGNLPEAERHIAMASQAYDRLGERRGQAGARAFLGAVQTRTRHFDQADESLRIAVELFRAVDDPGGEAETLTFLGALAIERDHPEQARKRYEDALRVARSIESALDEAAALEGLGVASRRLNEAEHAKAYFEEALKVYRGIPSAAGISRVAAELATLP
ncbi:MAG: tetratricopeptide repeat protein [Streptosporangiaceae bacterium]